jgi:hypothetical protein
MNDLSIRQMIGMGLVRAGKIIGGLGKKSDSALVFRNPFSCEHIRNNRVIGVHHGWNDVTIVGKNLLLDTMFGNSTPVSQIDPWYIGLINNSPSPVLVEGDTLASHAGWTEWASYSGNRKVWDDANASNKVKGTSTVSTFTMSATGTIYGILIASVASGTSGTLWATGAFDTTVDVVSADELKITYGIRT